MATLGWAASWRRRVALGLMIPCSIGAYACAAHESAPTREQAVAHVATSESTTDLHAFVAEASGFFAWNERSAFDARVTTEGLRVHPKNGAAWSIRATSLGAASRVEANGRHVSIAHEEVKEDVENRIDGIEQSFVIEKQRADLTIDLAIDGAVTFAPSLRKNALDIVAPDAPRFHYGKLAAFDVTGRALPVSMSIVDATHAQIRVDAAQAVYPVTVDPLVWAEEAKLAELHSIGDDFNGQSVAMSNQTIISGMQGRNGFRGAAAIFIGNGTAWSEQQELEDSLVSEGDQEGSAVAIDGDTCVFGGGTEVVVYARSGTTWTQQARIDAPNGGSLNSANYIAVKGDTLVFAGETFPNRHLFVYQRTGGSWSQAQDLVQTTDASAPGTAFMTPVAMTADTIVAGSIDATNHPGVAFFSKSGSTWALDSIHPITQGDGGTVSNDFQAAAAIDGTTVLFGDLNVNETYVFVKGGSGWSQQAVLHSNTPAANDFFGAAVAINGDTAFVGAPIHNLDEGAIFRFSRSGTTWTLDEQIEPADISSTSEIGSSISMTANAAVFGVPQQGARRGGVYVYTFKNENGDACTTAAQCHSGNCVDGVCCDTTCGGGAKDDCLACNGAKPGTCGPAQPSVTCRASIGDCDVAETCDGTSATCPADSVLANGTSCSGGACVAGVCATSDASAVADAGKFDAPAASSDSGCSIANARGGSGSFAWSFGFLFFAAIGAIRRRRSAARVSAAVIAVAAVACSTSDTSKPSSTTNDDVSTSHATGLDVTYATGGARISASRTSESELRLALTKVTRGAAELPIARHAPTRSGARATYDVGPVSEWYETSARGVEQGFDIGARPSGEGHLRLETHIDGFTPRRARSNDVVDLIDDADRVAFEYGELHAHDANGRALDAKLSVNAQSIVIDVDDERAAYPIAIDPLVWRQHQELSPDSGKATDFGISVAVSGDTALVGARGFDGNADAGGPTNSGEVYVYVRTVNAWNLQAKLVANDAAASAFFGRAVAIEGDTAMIGAGGTNSNAGAVYAFTRSGTTWTQTQKITGNDTVSGDTFGHAVALQDGALVVGANEASGSRGAFYIFDFNGTSWAQVFEAVGATSLFGGEELGTSVAIDDTTVVVGAVANTTVTQANGAAYAYTGSGSSWTKQMSVYPDGTLFDSDFGRAVAIQGDIALVGAPLSFSDPRVGGAVYAYTRSGTTWTFAQRFVTNDEADGDQVGTALAFHGNQALVGAIGANGGDGAAYLFQLVSGTSWVQANEFVASDPGVDDFFGVGLDFGNNMAMVGAYGHALNTGSTYAFFLGSEGGPCENGDPCATGYCVDGVCCDSPCGNGDPKDCVACSVAAGAATDGVCGASTPHLCRAATGDCDIAESCDGKNLTCPADVVNANGTTCSSGTCSGGKCLPVVTSAALDAGSAGPSAAAPSSDSGCGCHLSENSSSTRGFFGVIAFALLVLRRRARAVIRS